MDGNVQGRKYLYYQIRELKEQLTNKVSKLLDLGNEKYSSLHTFFLSDINILQSYQPLNKELLKEFIQNEYEYFYKTRYSFLSHYFRFVYHLIKFVDESLLNQHDKQKYIDLIQAQMTSDELGLLFFNGLGKIGNRKTYPLLEKYNFLSNLDTRVLLYPKLIVQLYSNTDFKYLNYDT